MNAPEDNPADDVQPTQEEWDAAEAERLSLAPNTYPECGEPYKAARCDNCGCWQYEQPPYPKGTAT